MGATAAWYSRSFGPAGRERLRAWKAGAKRRLCPTWSGRPADRAPADRATADLLAEAVVRAPAVTLRGGTNEILRSMVARGLGLR